jgi:hypothetical protein
MPRTGRTYHVIQVLFALMIFLLATLSTFSSSESADLAADTQADLMVVRYTCMDCSCQCRGPMYFTKYVEATRHWACSSPFNISSWGLATVVLPNTGRPGNAHARGTGAAAKWQGQGTPRRQAGLLGRSSSSGILVLKTHL